MPSAPPLSLGAQDVDAPVEDAPVQRDVVLLVLEPEDRLAQLVVGERRRIGVRRVLAVVRRVARPLEDRPLERSRGLQLEGSGGYLTAQAGDTPGGRVADA